MGEELYKLSTFNFLLTVAFAFLVSLPRRSATWGHHGAVVGGPGHV